MAQQSRPTTLTGSGSSKGEWSKAIEDYKQRLMRLASIAEDVAEEMILPLLERNYDASGLKTHSGMVKRAISKRGAPGNILKTEITSGGVRVTVGADAENIKEIRYALFGNAPKGGGVIRPVHAKALHFDLNGKPVFVKHVRPAPAHDTIYALSSSEEEAYRQKVQERVTEP